MEKQNGIAYEEHHIIPKCCYGSNNKSNLVTLTCREHFIAHRLLPYIYANTNPNDIPVGFKKGIGRPPWQKIQNG